ncbi:FAD:protein FMN transferase [Algoriphagus sediminis]|uniref:FAD:protein FMN transferase n=1 Tax=Algoriphagus sediminis TaxID=3057113 RepID=A0ABT7YCW2_9BACT|nr:FAD:protein FMN transferase [Algoriphagus sediminis]MDN3204327.1 FAD:protein FMN transferase [Algoriphagus sediminis]
MRPNARKNIVYSLILLLMVVVVYTYRTRDSKPLETEGETEVVGKISLNGQTMGTTYNVTYLDDSGRDFKVQIDSVLEVFNLSLSTYIPTSEISRFNQNDTLVYEYPFMYPILNRSKEIYEETGGAFDPTVGPLVNIWGFGPGGPEMKDSVDIRKMVNSVGFDKITFDETQLTKSDSAIYLDFSAIAKGYGVDVVAKFLSDKGIQNYLVEIGGDLAAKGVNDKGELWKLGVNRPNEESSSSDIYNIVALQDKGMATSGNYRNFYVRDSVMISHTIDPKTGYPVRHGLLSATVIAADCMTADAYATAMMVMGTEKAIELDERLDEIEVFLIYGDGDGGYESFASESLKPYLSFPLE